VLSTGRPADLLGGPEGLSLATFGGGGTFPFSILTAPTGGDVHPDHSLGLRRFL
jgi:hypothetical protein